MLTSMLLGPITTNFDGAILYEIVTPTGNSCPTKIQAFTNFPTISISTPFVVATPSTWEGVYNPVHNAFYDAHTTKSAQNILGFTDVSTCQSTAVQTYVCNGHAVATFTLTNSFYTGLIGTQPVTFVNVAKQ
jgi:hypothetical protein